MGMKQKRCPRCRKKRRFVEGGGDHEQEEREKAWGKDEFEGCWICSYCMEAAINKALKRDTDMPKKMNPVGTTPSTQRVADGIHEVPCCVNPVALLRVTGLAERYLARHPKELKDFKDDLEACTRAGEIYNMVWEKVNRKDG